MKRSLLTLFLIWTLTIQSALAFTPQASTNNSVEMQKQIDHAIATYNAFSSTPSKINFPSSEYSKAVNEYMEKHKINGPLPKAKFIKTNTYELSLKGKNIVVEINPILGIIRINGVTLVLNSKGGLKGQLEQVEKFLTNPKTISASGKNDVLTKTAELFFSILVPNASADCLSKYDNAIIAQTPEHKWYEKLPAEWPLAIIILAGLLLPPVAANIVAGTVTAGLIGIAIEGSVHAEKYDRIQAERKKKEDALEELVMIKGALSIAESGTVPPPQQTAERPFTQDELRFHNLYFKYSSFIQKTGGVLLSKEEFLKALATANKEEKLCSPTLLDTVAKVTEKIMVQNSSLDPNELIKNIDPITDDKAASTVDDHRRDAPKDVPDVGVSEQKSNSSVGVDK